MKKLVIEMVMAGEKRWFSGRVKGEPAFTEDKRDALTYTKFEEAMRAAKGLPFTTWEIKTYDDVD